MANEPSEKTTIPRGARLLEKLRERKDELNSDQKILMEKANAISTDIRARLVYDERQAASRLLNTALTRRQITHDQWLEFTSACAISYELHDDPTLNEIRDVVDEIRAEIDVGLEAVKDFVESSRHIEDYACLRAIAEIRSEREARKEKAVDPKTGFIQSPDYFAERYNAEILRLKYSPDKCLLMVELDLDDFKSENDFAGGTHERVDREILLPLVEKIKNVMRQSDIQARFGGDEMTLIFTGVNPESIQLIIDKLNEAIHSIPRISDPSRHLTASMGYAIVRQEEAANAPYATDLRNRADHAAKFSKRNGKNQATEWTPELPKIPRTVEIFEELFRTALGRTFEAPVPFLEELIKQAAEKAAAEEEKKIGQS